MFVVVLILNLNVSRKGGRNKAGHVCVTNTNVYLWKLRLINDKCRPRNVKRRQACALINEPTIYIIPGDLIGHSMLEGQRHVWKMTEFLLD